MLRWHRLSLCCLLSQAQMQKSLLPCPLEEVRPDLRTTGPQFMTLSDSPLSIFLPSHLPRADSALHDPVTFSFFFVREC